MKDFGPFSVSENGSREMAGSEDASDGGLVAEDDDLPGVLDRAEASAAEYGDEGVHAGIGLDIAALAADHFAAGHGLRGEEVLQPDFGGERGEHRTHERKFGACGG